MRLTYVDFDGKRSRRTLDPLGLVVKADRSYLVAGTQRGPSVFRGARIERARILDEPCTRPRGFDLPAFWKEWGARFAEKRASYPVQLRLDAAGAEALRAIRPQSEHPHLTVGTCTIDFERESIAIAQLCLAAAGASVEVLEPVELRERLRAVGAALACAHA